MTQNSSDATYPSFRPGPERIALALVLLVVLGLPLVVWGYRGLQAATSPVRVIELTGRLPTADHGGWTPEFITVRKGERVRLRLTSNDVVHGFAIPKLGVEPGWIEPGKVKEIEFVADRPGRYTFLCTVWCREGHWRMRGTLEVVDPEDPRASSQEVDPPQTEWMAYGIDIDAGHIGQFVPQEPPDAARGAVLWEQVSGRPIQDVLAELRLRELSPSDLFALLATDALPEGPQLARLTPAERWDIVAYLYRAATTREALATGARLYQRDCTGCHGPTGQGDGPGAKALAEAAASQDQSGGMVMDKPPVDFTDLAAQAGAPDLLYYGKIVRGGMGTSMPYWGTIYTEDELWALIAHLRGFAFQLEER